MLAALRVKVRTQAGRAAEPSAGVVDPQSVKGADTVGAGSRGYDAGKKVNGRKRFIVTDALGLLVTVWSLAASWQDRDGARAHWSPPPWPPPSMRYVFADQGFAGRQVEWAHDILKTTIEIVRKPADQRGCAVNPRRWVVERTLAWLTACRRLARDYERVPEVSEAIMDGRRSRAWLAGSPAANRPAGRPAERFIWT